MTKKQKPLQPLLILLAIVNIIPFVIFVTGGIELNQLATIYWVECALFGLFFLSIYARYIFVFIAVSFSVFVLVYIVDHNITEQLKTIVIFWSLFTIIWLGYVEFSKTKYSHTIRRLNPQKRGIAFLSIIALMIGFCLFLTLFITGDWRHVTELSGHFYTVLATCAAVTASFSLAMIKTIDMIGQRHFIDFILGTYHEPVEKDCVVMFLDMVGSSAMAEKLDARKSMDVIGRFIYDCGYILRIHGGDIINYTGDGLVVLWPSAKADGAIAAADMLRKHFMMKKTKAGYWKRFGIIPKFRLGIHAGEVVLNQIGEEKLFLGLYGDVVNTAARIEQLNKEVDTQILLSAQVGMLLSHSWRSLLRAKGEHEVRGREEKIKVYTLYS